MHCIQEIIPLPELCSVLQSCYTSLLGACVKPAYPNHSLDDALHKHPFTLNCPLGTLQRDRSNHTKDRYLV